MRPYYETVLVLAATRATTTKGQTMTATLNPTNATSTCPSDDTWEVAASLPEAQSETELGEYVWLKINEDWFALVGPDADDLPALPVEAILEPGWYTETQDSGRTILVHFWRGASPLTAAAA